MGILDLWILLTGIVLAFILQVLYDMVGENSHGISKSRLGFFMAMLSAFLVFISAYFLGYLPNSGESGIAFISTAFIIVIAFSILNLIPRKKPNGIKKNDEREMKITIKNGEKELDVKGVNADTVQKILKSWKASDYLFVILVLILTFLPFIIVVANQIDFNKDVTSSYLNGLITACGVFVGFITASFVSKAKDLNFNIFSMMRITLLLFTASIIKLSLDLIVGDKATVLDVTLFSSTLILASITAWNIMNTLFKGQV
jgi:hypothetical protein